MPNGNRITKVLSPSPRFARSIRLERDFADSTALDQYVVTQKVEQLSRRFSNAFRDGSTERAWRITGDYGTGKSCFALAMARLYSSRNRMLPKPLASLAKSLPTTLTFPVLVTASREPVSAAIVRSIKHSLGRSRSRKKPDSFSRADNVLRDADPSSRDRFSIELLEDAAAFVRQTNRGNGILLILDELGKALEFATHNPDAQDITFLQTLAETATRSGSVPLIVLGILHQGFTAYADKMEATDQREWDKIGGRFEELLFDQPLDQLFQLVSRALGVRSKRLPSAVTKAARENMAKAIEFGWFGASNNKQELIKQAPAIYPLQPMLLPVLVKFFSRFGQNERSLFSFLYSTDVNALRAFADLHSVGEGFFGIHHLYDFVRSSIGHRLHTRTLSSRWNQIESVIEASLSGNAKEVAVLKTVGILNMLDDQTLFPTEEVIEASMSRTCLPNRPSTTKAIAKLRSDERVLYKRGAAGGYCLWPHTSVDLELKYVEAERTIRCVHDVVHDVRQILEERPIVARRHYVETGNLRHFALKYVTSGEFESAVQSWEPTSEDGVVFVPLSKTTADRRTVIDSIKRLKLRTRDEILVAVPQPVNGFAGLVAEFRRWEWVRKNVPELDGDKYAREEVSRQIAAARAVLRDRTNQVLDVRSFRNGQGMEWYHKGMPVEIESARDLFSMVSDISDTVFDESPILKNELLNRRKLSSAAAAARMRLIERVLENATDDFLGMDEKKRPPEMSMYLSALQHTKLHVNGKAGPRIQLPRSGQDACNLLPTFRTMREILSKDEGKRISVQELFERLREPPIGARDGVLPLLLAVFCVADAQHVAMYEDGIFLQEIGGAEFARLTKAPETFEMQYCRLSGIRSQVFNQLLQIIDTDVDPSRAPDIIDVVKPLCKFAAGLPDYSQNTTVLGKKTLAVRDALLNATEPATLLFEDLPAACGLSPISSRNRSSNQNVKKYVKDLKRALGELRSAYPNLLGRIEKQIAQAFAESGATDSLRRTLDKQASALSIHVTEATLKAFCLRLADTHLSTDAWLESIGSLVAAKPPRRWLDRDEPRFHQSIIELVHRFKQTASMAFPDGVSTNDAIRISLLLPNGVEQSEVVGIDASEKEVAAELEKQLEAIIDANPQLAIAAATRVFLKHLGTT